MLYAFAVGACLKSLQFLVFFTSLMSEARWERDPDKTTAFEDTLPYYMGVQNENSPQAAGLVGAVLLQVPERWKYNSWSQVWVADLWVWMLIRYTEIYTGPYAFLHKSIFWSAWRPYACTWTINRVNVPGVETVSPTWHSWQLLTQVHSECWGPLEEVAPGTHLYLIPHQDVWVEPENTAMLEPRVDFFSIS